MNIRVTGGVIFGYPDRVDEGYEGYAFLGPCLRLLTA
jgi:hypothetical protein